MTDEELVQRVRDVAGTVQMKSQAMRPLAWLVAIVAPSATVMIVWGPDWVKIFGAGLLSVALVAYIAAYIYWAIKDPDRLGSEQFIVQRDVIAFSQQTKFDSLRIDTHAVKDPSPPKFPTKGGSQ